MKGLFDAVKNFFYEYYYIPPLDLADTAETNRHRNCVWSVAAGCMLIVDFVFVFALTRGDFSKSLVWLAYLGASFLDISLSVFLSFKFKGVDRRRAWLLKNIPIYVVFCWGMGSCSYVYYVIGHQLIAVVHFFIAVAIMLSIFSLAPGAFSVILLAGAAGLLPGLCSVFGLASGGTFAFAALFLVFLSFYKRGAEKRYLSLLKNQKKFLEAKTFGNFTLLHQNKVVKFSRTKSSELLAYLVYKNGSAANTKELIGVLYGESADSERYGSSLRSLVSDVKRSLMELGVQDFFIAEYNNFRVNPESVQCDFYDFLAGDAAAQKKFTGQFMSQYSWAEGVAEFLERKVIKRNA